MIALADFRRSFAPSTPSPAAAGDRILNLAEVTEAAFRISEYAGVDHERRFFGMPITEAVAAGYQVTARGLFDATESAAATHTAKALRRLFCADPRPRPLRILDLFAGTAQMAWAFVQEGFEVESAEIDPVRALVATNNARRAGFEGKWTLDYTNALSLLKELTATNRRFDAVYLDPPWAGRYQYDLREHFTLEQMAPSGLVLLDRALKLSDVVAIKCPQSISFAQTEEVCRNRHLWGKLEFQNISALPSELNQATAYFVKRGRYPHLLNFSFETVTLKEDKLTC